MSITKKDKQALEKIARSYTNWFKARMIAQIINPAWNAEIEEEDTFSDFAKEEPDLCSLVLRMEGQTGIFAEEIIRRDVKLDSIGFGETAFSSSLGYRRKIQDSEESVLENGAYLSKSYSDILNDRDLTDYEKVLFITLKATGSISATSMETAFDTLTPYLGNTAPGESSGDKSFLELDDATIRKYPVVREILLRSRMQKFLTSHYFFRDEDDRTDWYNELVQAVEEEKTNFDEGTVLHSVYEELIEKFEELYIFEIPHAKERIRDPTLKIDNLELLVEGLETEIGKRAVWPFEQFEKLGNGAGKAARDAILEHILSIDGEDYVEIDAAYKALTVVFPSLHQRIGIKEVYDKKRVLIADKQGSGKTAQAILAVPSLEDRLNRTPRAIVISPLSMCNEWEERVHVYLKQEEENGRAYVVSSHERMDALEEGLENATLNPQFIIINYEKLMRGKWDVSHINDYLESLDQEENVEARNEFSYKLAEVREKYIENGTSELKTIIEGRGGEVSGLYSREQHLRYLTAVLQIEEDRKIVERLKNLKTDVLIVDESQKAKNAQAKCTEAVEDLALHTEYLILLSASPVPKSEDDLSVPVRLLNGTWDSINRKFTPAYTHSEFKKTFATNSALLHGILKPRMLRRTLDETVPELRGLLSEEVVEVPMSTKQREAYIKILEDSELKGSQQLIALRRLSLDPQLADKYYDGPLTSPKYEKLYCDLNSHEGQVVIYTAFKDGVMRRGTLDPQGKILSEQLEEKYGSSFAFIDGDVPNHEREEIIHQFRQGEIKYLLATAQTMSLGVDLSSADRVIHLEHTYIPDDKDQQNRRVYRRGQTQPVNAQSYCLVDSEIMQFTKRGGENLAGTVDEGILKLHERRKLLTALLIDGIPLQESEMKEIFSDSFLNQYIR